jgi:anti-anti-sigma factor
MTEETWPGRSPDAHDPQSPALRFRFDPGTRRMTLYGELDFTNGAVLSSAISAIHGRDPGHITLDIRELRFTDPASVTLFLASCKALGGEGVPVLIDGATSSVRRACDAAGLGALLS